MQRTTLEALRKARREGRLLVRAIDMDSGEERLVDPATDASPLGAAAARMVRDGASGSLAVDGRSWFFSVYDQPWELVIVGAVHIAQALAGLAQAAGYRVRIIDPRAAYATDERFSDMRLVRAWPDEALAAEPLTPHSALVVLAHDPKLDDAALMAALRSPAAYIGALGSSRTQAVRKTRLAGNRYSAAELSRIRGPVGLAIGARTPAEIAIAILAELVAVRRKETGARADGIILAAGTSSRMGHNKLLADIAGKPLVRRVAEAAIASRLATVTVVTGHEADKVQAALHGLPVGFAHNPAFADGLGGSLGVGIRALPDQCEGGLILLGDMPDITPGLINQTIALFNPGQGRTICVTTAKGVRGHPVLWGRQFFGELTALKGDSGARALYAIHPDHICEVEAGSDAPLADIDTMEALDTWRHSKRSM